MMKNIAKFAGGAVGIVVIGLGALFAVDYFRYQNSPEYQAEKEAEAIKKEYAEDPYGGDTPEETLWLFVDALKKGDTDLAAKYFVLDKQEEWRGDLAKIQEKGLLGDMIRDLGTTKRGKDFPRGDALFSFVNQDNEVISTMRILKSQNNKWKIQDL